MLNLLICAALVFLVMKFLSFGFRANPPSSLKIFSEIELTIQNLKKRVEYLSLTIGIRDYLRSINLQQTADYIEKEFQALNYHVERMPYSLHGQTFYNVIAEKKIPTRTDEIILIGAHYDTCGNPGADDNASGIAGLLELARLLQNQKFSRHLRLAAFVNEEPPFFRNQMGSQVYANLAKQRQENLKAVIILEMIGYYSDQKNSQRYPPGLGAFYPNQGNFIAVIGNFPSVGLAQELAKHFKKHSDFPLETLIAPSWFHGVSLSDHASFWNAGYRAVMVTDTAFLRNPNYHKSTDLPETLDYERMALVIHGLKDAVLSFLK